MCYECLGFDVMFDSDYNPYLVEVNHAPSFTTDSAFDEKVKHKVLTDTLKILYNVGPAARKAFKEFKQHEMDMK
jgi:D-alanine-D-alanine ligase-like ATP-grasp enzyme